MRTFTLERISDESGVSGTGLVLEGVEFSDATVVVRWKPGQAKACSTAVYRSFADFAVIHILSHPTNGTMINFSDGETLKY